MEEVAVFARAFYRDLETALGEEEAGAIAVEVSSPVSSPEAVLTFTRTKAGDYSCSKKNLFVICRSLLSLGGLEVTATPLKAHGHLIPGICCKIIPYQQRIAPNLTNLHEH